MVDPVLRVLIVDDEQPAREKVARLLGRDARFCLVGQAADGVEALSLIEQLTPDLLVLDIQMPGLSGFEMLDSLSSDVQIGVLFSTAHDEHALEAFEAHAIDYLLKPYAAERFARALDKAYYRHLGSQRAVPRTLVDAAVSPQRTHLALRTVEGAWIQLAISDIVRISAANKHVCVYTDRERHVVRQSMRELLSRLDQSFARVHRSDIVNVSAVQKIEPWDHGDALITLRGGATLVLTRTFRRSFLQQFDGSSEP